MKYIISIGVVVLLLGGMWWIQNDNVPSTPFSNRNEVQTKDLMKLPEHAIEAAKPTEIVELNDGDTYDMEATIITQEVGNRTIKRLAYNGQIPGPILKVQKGAKVTVNFTNNIDMETALHSHGLRGDYLMDGAVPITSAIPVGESFSYELEFPDTGVFWYHPHVREDYQQELGLYGNFIVEEDGYWNEVNQEEYLILDDYLEDGDFSREFVSNTLMGRFGDTLLINDQEDYVVNVEQGKVARIFLTNVANTRTFDVSFEGAETKLVGGDLGRIEKEAMVDDVIIAPAERYIVEVLYSEAGTYPILHRGKQIGGVFVKAGSGNETETFSRLRNNASDYTDIRNNVATLMAQEPDKNLRLTLEMKGMMGNMMRGGMQSDDDMMREHCQMMPEMAGCEPYLEESGEHDEADGIEWEDSMAMMNQMSTDDTIEWIIEDTDTKKQNGDIDWSFATGDLVKVRIYNDENSAHPMQHPIHFHGQRFVVLARDGEVNDNLQWKDTVLIPKGQTVDLLVDMSNPGKWMTHCHIAEHLHSGMMFQFKVE